MGLKPFLANSINRAFLIDTSPHPLVILISENQNCDNWEKLSSKKPSVCEFFVLCVEQRQQQEATATTEPARSATLTARAPDVGQRTPAHPSMAIAANKEFHKWKHQKTFHPVSLVHAELDEKHYPASPSLDVILSAVYIFCNSMFDLKYSRQYWGPHRGRGYGMAFLSKKRGTVAK